MATYLAVQRMTSFGFSNICKKLHSCNKLVDRYSTKKKRREKLPAPYIYISAHTRTDIPPCTFVIKHLKSYIGWAPLAIAERHVIFGTHTQRPNTRTYTYELGTLYSCGPIPNHSSTRVARISSRPVDKERGPRACITHIVSIPREAKARPSLMCSAAPRLLSHALWSKLGHYVLTRCT